jgi:adhesin transport system membrane fusion protein
MRVRNPLDWLLSFEDTENAGLISEVEATATRAARRFALILLVVIGTFLTAIIVWASTSEIDDITRGRGQVIPSGQNKVVQHLEGGIVRAILVKEGDTVKAGQVLLRIDSTPSKSLHQEKLSTYYADRARAARLKAEADGKDKITFAPEVLKKAPEAAKQERALFASRRQSHATEIDVLERQVRQKQQELRETQSGVDRLQARLKSERQELVETRRDYAAGAIARFDLLRLERQVNETAGSLRTEKLKIPRAQAALRETQSKLDEKKTSYLADVRKELADVENKIAALKPVIQAGEARVERTEIRSPVKGIVKLVGVTTLGAVIKPGEPLVEIVPLDSGLIVEAKIRPQDRAFLHPGQTATVKVSAYDFSIYGGLEGKVVDISADAIEEKDSDRKRSYYRVRVRTDKNYLERAGQKLPIITGMTVTVDIRTGHRTILDHVLSPFYKLIDSSLQER